MEKAKELDNRHQGDRGACPICSPKKDRIREDQVWGHCPTNRLHPATLDHARETDFSSNR